MSRVSDHFQYLSLIGVVALSAAALTSAFQPSWAWPWWRRGIGYFLGSFWFFSTLAMQRARDGERQSPLARYPGENPTAWNAHNNLAYILAKRRIMTQPFHHRLSPNQSQRSGPLNLARALVLKGDLRKPSPFPGGTGHHTVRQYES
jgi:hypothetical protein